MGDTHQEPAEGRAPAPRHLYTGLKEALAEIGVKESERNIANKISRGGFSAVFLLQCLSAIGVRDLHLDAEATSGRRNGVPDGQDTARPPQ